MDDAIVAYGQAVRVEARIIPRRTTIWVRRCRHGDGWRRRSRPTVRPSGCQPDYATAWSNLGSALQGRGNLDEAIAAYREALRLNPDYAMAHYNLGNALRVLRRPNEAIDACRAAVRLKPDFPEAHSNLGAVLQRAGASRGRTARPTRMPLRLRPDWGSAAAAASCIWSGSCADGTTLPRVRRPCGRPSRSTRPSRRGSTRSACWCRTHPRPEQLRCARQWVAHKRFLRAGHLPRALLRPATRRRVACASDICLRIFTNMPPRI